MTSRIIRQHTSYDENCNIRLKYEISPSEDRLFLNINTYFKYFLHIIVVLDFVNSYPNCISTIMQRAEGNKL